MLKEILKKLLGNSKTERPMPTHITLENTSACNLRCFMCEHHRPGVFNKKDMMEHNLFCKVIDEVKDTVNCLSLTVTGDPFCDPQLAKRLTEIKKYPQIALEVVTNGILLTEQNLKIFADLENHIHFSISVDTLDPKIYHSIRSLDKHSEVLKNIGHLKEFSQKLNIKNVHQNISMVMMKRNIECLVDFLVMSAGLGCDSVGVSHITVFEEKDAVESLFHYPVFTNNIIAQAKAKAESLGLVFNSPPPFAVTEEEIVRYHNSKIVNCPFLDGRVYVGHDGRVEACCRSGRPIMGNILRIQLKTVWNNNKYAEYRKALFEGAPKQICRHCYVLEHYKEFLYDSKPFGLEVPPENRSNKSSL